MKKTLLTLTAIGTMAISGASFAVDAPKDAPKDGGPKGAPKDVQGWKEKKFKEFDTNNDGKISKDEYLSYEGKKFDDIDAKKSGFITPADFEAYHEKMRAEHGDRMGKGPHGEHGHGPKGEAGHDAPPAGGDDKGAE